MRLYLVKADGPFEYDTVTSAVVWASSRAEAIELFSNVDNVGEAPYVARAVPLSWKRARVIHTEFHPG